ncbi:hypothetical protein [Goodfellowiella coeruleoviolacea]|uniref:Uncharacterized protein n=1 Tax=Goodfellowiella coeruleoviolacea TaxID=334858 RepID=A0AAE3GFE0_9PSEU|nr:hypothetical protein [Goodfellowiella coeruleoviolacea]MCP2167110.1 hypothetical protein [Goodfellowiella coeruleoviolacea]
MSDRIPAAVVAGRKVAMVLLVTAMVLTVLCALWLVSLAVTAPAVV